MVSLAGKLGKRGCLEDGLGSKCGVSIVAGIGPRCAIDWTNFLRSRLLQTHFSYLEHRKRAVRLGKPGVRIIS